MEKGRSLELDNAKWILTLLIVLYHIKWYEDGVTGLLPLYIKNLGNCVVPAFSLISGFLFWKNTNSITCVKNKIRRRVTSLLIPYIVWNFINTIIFVNLIKIWPNIFSSQLLDINIWQNIIKWDSTPHFWYIFMLMFWTILSPVLLYVYRDKRIFAVFCIVQMAYIIYMGNSILQSRFIYIMYTWGGYLGYRFPNVLKKLIGFSKEKKIVIGSASFVLYFFLGIFTTWYEFGMRYNVWIMAFRSLFLLVGALCVPLLLLGKKLNYRYSFWLFAVHYWLDKYIGRMVKFFIGGIPNQIITFGLVLCVGLCLGIVIKKYFSNFFDLLSGNR